MNWLLGLLACIAVAPFLREALRPPISSARKDTAPGDFAILSRGTTYYRWRGPVDAPIAVCVHGLTTPSLVWDRIADALVDMGFRVLTYDLYGRGLSDRARGLQDADFFARQLEELLSELGTHPKITLLGYSMGGAIVPAFAARHMDQLRQIVLIAPAGLGHDLGPASRIIANTGLLGKWLMLTVYARSMRRACNAERSIPSSIAGITDVQVNQINDRGFLPAVLSSLRGILDAPLDDAHRAIATAAVPTLAIWGEEDDVIPLVGRDTLAALNPHATSVVIDGAGHTLPYTDDDAVVAVLRDHLIRPDRAPG
ncbi:alpha/beta hydrolase [Pseudohalocynthiibacter aestuariivivens]|nr:alpha/beta hydrolase [Pseudohalocynthiibacter aestuariivivens]QIE46591.1 alpha/beta hydrolase [Pseudohalocynthiibacter aestuariivivens]